MPSPTWRWNDQSIFMRVVRRVLSGLNGRADELVHSAADAEEGAEERQPGTGRKLPVKPPSDEKEEDDGGRELDSGAEQGACYAEGFEGVPETRTAFSRIVR